MVQTSANMKQVTLHISAKKFPFFLELAKSLSFVKRVEVDEDNEPTKEEILLELTDAFKEVKLIQSGKLKGRPLKALLDEL